MPTIQERLGGIEARLESLCLDTKRLMLFLTGNGDPEGGMIGEVARLRDGAQRRKRFVVVFHVAVLALLGGILTDRWATRPNVVEPAVQEQARGQVMVP